MVREFIRDREVCCVLIRQLLIDQKHPKAFEADIAQRQLVAPVILAKPSRATGARGYVDILEHVAQEVGGIDRAFYTGT